MDPTYPYRHIPVNLNIIANFIPFIIDLYSPTFASLFLSRDTHTLDSCESVGISISERSFFARNPFLESSMDPFTNKLLDKALDNAFKEVSGVLKIIHSSKSSAKELKGKLSSLKPTIDEIIKVISELDESPDIVRTYQNFQADLQGGLLLVEDTKNIHSFNIYRKYRYGKRVLMLQNKISGFIQLHGEPDLIYSMKKTEAGLNKVEAGLRDIPDRVIETIKDRMTKDPNFNTRMLQQIDENQIFQIQTPDQVLQTPSDDVMHKATATQQSVSCADQVPLMPGEFVVGLNNPVNAVKKILLHNSVNVVGVTGMGGSGKTTLAFALCKDPQVKDFFGNNVIFLTISKIPNETRLLEILETIWDKTIGGKRPKFGSIEDARIQLQNQLRRTAEGKHQRTLMVLDDVWSKTDLEKLLFEAKGYKTLVTTREDSIVPRRRDAHLHRMRMLEVDNALRLFCFSAFDQPSIPSATELEDDIVKQVAAKCKGLPLALKVIGSSLRGEPSPVWEIAKKKLSRAESISQYYKDNVLDRLQMSIDVLDDESKQCFLDLGAFPEGRKFSIDSLLDTWVYVRGMESQYAFVVLLELASRNLLSLTRDPGNGGSEYSSASELCFSQHALMRDLALHLASQDTDSIIQRKRLFMPCKVENFSTEWRTLINQSSKAQFLSIHTGAMAEQDWCVIDFPEVEALALFFAASEYCLPTFLHTMPKLKVVFIYNCGSKRAVLHGLPSFPSFTQIKSVLLERLILSSLYDCCKSWESLEKLHVCLCEGLGNMTLSDKEDVLKFPKIVDITLDHCSDLAELPRQICDLTSIQRLSVTNCHLIQKLPDDLGRLSSLKALRLFACPSLKMLPPSICKLEELQFFDISLCSSLKDLPMEFDQLLKLKTLDMRECSGLKKLPKGLTKLRSLRRVICDENIARQWRPIKASALPLLTIVAVEECFSVDWLDD